MNLNSFELSISSNGSISIPKFIGINEGDELILFQGKNGLVLLSLGELKLISEKIQNDTSLGLNKRKRLIRNIFPFCISVSNFILNDNNIQFILPKKVIDKYNLSDKLICEVYNNKVYLWEPTKYLEYQNSLCGSSKISR